MMESTHEKSSVSVIATDLTNLSISTKRAPPGFDQQYVHVVLDFQELTEIPSHILNQASSIRTMSLKGNELTSLTSLDLFHSLEELYLSENILTTLHESFCCLKRLCILELTGNSLKTIPLEISNLTSLHSLILDENMLTSLPESLTNLNSLEHLDLTVNKLAMLPENFGNLRNLTVLNLSNNFLVRLPDSFSALTLITTLDLSDNKLECLPDNCQFGATLEYLYVERNELISLPKWINNLPVCEKISFRGNAICGTPFTEEFGENNQNIRLLDLTGNNIEQLPQTIGELLQLKVLKLGSMLKEIERSNFQNGNWIKVIPESFVQLSSLTQLHFDENHLMTLPDSVGELRSLTFLNLGQNNLRSLPDSFCKLFALEVCVLSKNMIEYLPKNIGDLRNLYDLRLDDNKLTDLPDSLQKLKKLSVLDLFRNELTEIPDWVDKLPLLSSFDIDLNNMNIEGCDLPSKIDNHKPYPPRDPKLKDNWRGRNASHNTPNVPVLSNIDDEDVDGQFPGYVPEPSAAEEQDDESWDEELAPFLTSSSNAPKDINWEEVCTQRHKFCPGTEHAKAVLRRQESAFVVTKQNGQFDDAEDDDS